MSEASAPLDAPLIEEAPPASSAPPKWVAPALRWYHWVVVVLVDMIGPFSTDSYIPNLPQMTKDLHTTASLAGATLQFNWIVKAVSTVAIGFLSDRPAIGRRTCA